MSMPDISELELQYKNQAITTVGWWAKSKATL